MSAPDYEALAYAIWNEHWNVPMRDCDRYERALRRAARIEADLRASRRTILDSYERGRKVDGGRSIVVSDDLAEAIREALEADTE